jgi:membrane-bound lytic murein transglycosylase D
MLVMTGCGSQQFVTQLWPWKQDPQAGTADLSKPFPQLPSATGNDSLNPSTANSADFDFDRREVERYVSRFQSDLRSFYGRALERSGRFVPTMSSILEREGIPIDLVYLPLIESGFQTGAVSRAGAVGPWQFMRQTGRRYGLRIDQYVDERRDPIKSTEAAARYLRDLYDMFNDWHLSLAAYNTGEGNIARILERRGSQDYWAMGERGYLVRETKEYVPRFLAALQIARSPESYGFERPAGEAMAFDWVRVNRPVNLSTVADICGTSTSKIRELNPALTRGVVPHSGYTLRIPQGTKQTFMAAAATLPAPKVYAAKAPSGRRCSGMQSDGTYCLRAGETIGSVAERYGVSTQALLKANDISNPRRVAAGQPLVIPGQRPQTSGRTYAAAPSGKTRTASFTHRVRSGETIGSISARYGLTPTVVARANQIRNVNRLRVGQILQIPSHSARASSRPEVATKKVAAAAKPALKEPSAPARVATREAERNAYTVPSVTDPPRAAAAQRTHTVRSGETPATIAKRHGVALDELLRANGVRDPRRIPVGRTLVIPGTRTAAKTSAPRSASTTRTHKVASGETVADIAGRYGVSTSELLRANGIRDVRRLQVGRTLVVPAAGKRAAQAPRAQGSTIHTVRPGDTLYSIAQRYRVSLSALTSANGIRDGRSIRVGQKLKIPQQVASK